jgi:hypothetical protein
MLVEMAGFDRARNEEVRGWNEMSSAIDDDQRALNELNEVSSPQ